MPPLTSKDLESQVHNPQHVFIETAPGRLIRHSDSHLDTGISHPYYREGLPIRYTLLAAQSVLRSSYYKNARMIPCHTSNGKQ